MIRVFLKSISLPPRPPGALVEDLVEQLHHVGCAFSPRPAGPRCTAAGAPPPSDPALPYPTYPAGSFRPETVWPPVLGHVDGDQVLLPAVEESERASAVSVFPTPLGPTRRKTPVGLEGLDPGVGRPDSLVMASRAWSWPMSPLPEKLLRRRTVSISSACIRPVGIPVHPR